MSNQAVLVWIISAFVLVAILVYELIRTARLSTAPRQLRQYLILIAILAIIAPSIILYISQTQVESKGSGTAWSMIVLMYVAMLLGVIAQAYYFAEANSWPSVASWLKPMLASPIIFLPLVSSYQMSISDLSSFSLVEFMILLVAFQNGFFWKTVFDRQSELVKRRGSQAR